MRTLTEVMKRVHHARGGGACRDAVAGQVRWTQQLLLADASDDVRRELMVALADQHNLAGWTSFDTRMFSTAHAHYAHGATLSHHAGEPSLTAMLLYNMGRVYMHRRLHDEALKSYQLGVVIAQAANHPRAMAALHVNEAWVHAMVGNRPQALRSVARAEDEFAEAGQEDVQAWTAFFNTAELRAITGFTLTTFLDATDNDLAAGVDHIVGSVAARTTGEDRYRVSSLPVLAAAHLRAGNTDEALRITDEAIDSARTMRSIQPIDRLVGLTSALAATGRPDAADLVHRINNVAATRTPQPHAQAAEA
jgi:tetratricopeptide (TPR) repeat protein